MGVLFGNKAWANPLYIVNLTTAIIGKTVLDEMKARLSHETSVEDCRSLTYLIAPQIRKMSSEKLGKICAYGTAEGFHRDCRLSEINDFISRTGFDDLGGVSFPSGITGRAMIEEIAISVVICIARDILIQEKWERMREDDRAHDVEIGFETPK